MQKFSLVAGSIFGALAVMIGAFGAHALKNMLTQTNRLETFETAVKYQFYHAPAVGLTKPATGPVEGVTTISHSVKVKENKTKTKTKN